MGGSAPRILSLDDYFMMETETEETDPESGRKVIIKKVSCILVLFVFVPFYVRVCLI